MNKITSILILLLFTSCQTFSPAYLSHKINRTNKNDEKHGLWVEIIGDEKNAIAIIKYKNGLKHGIYREVSEGDFSAHGHYKKDVKVGLWKSYYKDCLARVIEYKNGKPQTRLIGNCPF